MSVGAVSSSAPMGCRLMILKQSGADGRRTEVLWLNFTPDQLLPFDLEDGGLR